MMIDISRPPEDSLEGNQEAVIFESPLQPDKPETDYTHALNGRILGLMVVRDSIDGIVADYRASKPKHLAK
jgi:hypothetical protein